MANFDEFLLKKVPIFGQKTLFFVKIEIIEKFDYFGWNNRGSNSRKCSK